MSVDLEERSNEDGLPKPSDGLEELYNTPAIPYEDRNTRPDLRELEGGEPEEPETSVPTKTDPAYTPDEEMAAISVGSKRSKRKKGALYMYFASSVISVAISSLGLITFLLPQGVLSWIETKIDAVTNQMVDKATDRFISSYMKNVVGPRAKACGNNVNPACTVKVDGDGYMRSIFRTVQQAQADDLLAKKGVFVNYNRTANGGAGSYTIVTPRNSVGFDLTDVGPDSFDFDRFKDVGPRESYKAIKSELKVVFEEEGKIKKFLKTRYHLGVLKEKYKLKKCAIFCKAADTVARKIVNNKIVNKYKALKVKMVTKLSARMGIFMDCMMKGGCSDIDFNSDSETIKNSLKDVGLDADNLDDIDFSNVNFERLVQELDYAESRALRGGILDAIKTKKKLFMKKILTAFLKKLGAEAPEELAEKLGTKTIPVIGQILFVLMIVDLISRVESGITDPDGWFKKSVNAMKAADMIDSYALFTQSASESKLGGLSMDEVGSLVKDLSGLGSSRIFQGMILGKTGEEVNKYQEDCPNSGKIEDGKPICQEYAMNYLPEIAQIYANSPLSTIADFGLASYRGTISGLTDDLLPEILQDGECFRLSICGIYRFIMGSVNWAFDKAIDSIPGASQLLGLFAGFVSDIFDKLGISDFFMNMINKIAPRSDCSDTISSGNANCVFGGAFRTSMDSNKTNFDAPKQDNLAFRQEYKLAMESQTENFKALSFKERLFSLDNPRSLISKLVQNTTFDNNKLGSLAFNPGKQLSFAYASFDDNINFNPSAYAQSSDEEANFVNAFEDDVYFWPSGVIESATQEEVDNCGAEGKPQHQTCPLYFGVAELFSSSFVKATDSSSSNSGSSSGENNTFVDGQKGSCPGVASTRPNSGKPKNDIPVQVVPGTSIDIFEGYCMNALELINAAKADGITLNGGGFRTYDEQVNLRRTNCGSSNYDIHQKPSSSCSPPTASPGNSNHEAGLAIDFSYNGQTLCYKRPTCNTGENPAYDWLVANAGNFGFKKLKSEAWHWSSNGK